MSKTYYKLVRKNFETNEYVSFLVHSKNTTIYKLNEWVEASKECREKGYHLLVFNSIEDANLFISVNHFVYSESYLFKCKIQNEIELPYKLIIENGDILWEEIWGEPLSLWPDGTIMAEKVKIYGKPIKEYRLFGDHLRIKGE